MVSTLNLLGFNLMITIVFMCLGWLVSLKYRNVTVVDSMWGAGFVLIVWISFLGTDGFVGRSLLLCILVTLWGGRLSIHLTRRNWGQGEDPRYGKWRVAGGERFWVISLFKVFLLQALFLWAIALNVQLGVAASAPSHFTRFDLLGLLIWSIGFMFEAVADWQLAAFKSDPANHGRTMRKGLWAFSRHPNYFGEILVWWGVFMITLSQPANLWTVISPVLITLVVLKMTGVPLTEKHISQKRSDYECYRKKTNAVVPWFPKKGGGCEYAD